MLVVFDLYGTLIRPRVMHHPFRKIMRWAKEQGRKPRPDDARALMTADKENKELLAGLGIYPPSELLEQLHHEIQEELDSLTLFDDVQPAIDGLVNAGFPLAVCSNLSKPYGAAIERLLPQAGLMRCLSYQVGAIKPEREIYDWIVRESGVPAQQILFIGDTRLMDYEGPIKYGFRALHLVRNQPTGGGTIASLEEILSQVMPSRQSALHHGTAEEFVNSYSKVDIMDTNYIAQAIVDSVAFAKRAHIDNPVSPDDAVRFHDHATPYIVHPIWCAMTIMSETALDESLRLQGFLALMWHDVLEDTKAELPGDTSDEVRSLIVAMSFPSFRAEQELIWQRSTTVRLLKLYDKTSNLLDASHLSVEKWNAYVELTHKLAGDVEKHFGQLNIVRIAKAIAVKR